jgi:hydrogenase maturation protease
MNLAVLGLGNILVRDEGVGVRVVEELNKRFSFSPPIKLIDAGTLGFSLIHEIQDCEKLIIVDAVKAGNEPGTIYKFKREDFIFKLPQTMFAHDVGFLEALEQWKVLGIEPDIVFIGIEPQDMSSWGMELSICIKNKISKLIDIIIKELKNNGINVVEN